ncbi:MAG: class I SAM-dependent DNA methyltransferase [Sciscionella sp.]
MQDCAPFDTIGKRYEELFLQRSAQLAAGEWLITELGVGAKVLDLGCGGGWPTAMQLADAGLNITGIDLSPAMVAIASDRVPSGEFTVADLTGLPAELGRFDGVTAFLSLSMVGRAELPAVLGRIGELLRPSGCFALSTLDGTRDRVAPTILSPTVAITEYRLDELADLLAGTGFAVVARETVEVTIGQVPQTQHYLRARRDAAGSASA